jgi:hypothetical protein
MDGSLSWLYGWTPRGRLAGYPDSEAGRQATLRGRQAGEL